MTLGYFGLFINKRDANKKNKSAFTAKTFLNDSYCDLCRTKVFLFFAGKSFSILNRRSKRNKTRFEFRF